jgi:hypothetical protein
MTSRDLRVVEQEAGAVAPDLERVYDRHVERRATRFEDQDSERAGVHPPMVQQGVDNPLTTLMVASP